MEKAAGEFLPDAWAHEIERALSQYGIKLSPAGERAAIQEYVAAGGAPTAEGVAKVVDKVVGTPGGTEVMGEGSAAAANLRGLKNSDMGRPGGVPPIEPSAPPVEAPTDAWQRMTNEANHMEALGTTPKVPADAGAPEGAGYAGNANEKPWQEMVTEAERQDPRAPYSQDRLMGEGMPDVEGTAGTADKTLRGLRRGVGAAGAAGAAGGVYNLIAGPGSGTDTDPTRVGPPSSAKAPAEGGEPEEISRGEEVPTTTTEKPDSEAFDRAAEDAAAKGGQVPGHAAARTAGKIAAVKTPLEFYKALGAATARENKLGNLQAQDAAVWDSKRDKIWDLYKEEKGRTDWAAAAEVFGQLVVQWMAGAQGMRSGVDMTGVKFHTNDWSKAYDRLLDEARLELKDVDTRQAHDQHRVDEINKQIAEAQKQKLGVQHDIAEFGGKAELEAQKEQNQADIHAANNATSIQVANIGAAARGGKDVDHATRAAAAKSGFDMADKKLSEYNEAATTVNAADLLDKRAKEHDTAVRALGRLAHASGDKTLMKAIAAYKEGSTGAWNKMFGDNPMPALNAAIDRGRASLEKSREGAHTEMREASGLDRPRTAVGGSTTPVPPAGSTGKTATDKNGKRFWIDAKGNAVAPYEG